MNGAPRDGVPPNSAGAVHAAVDSFLDYVKQKSPSEHTLVNYAVDLRQFLDFLEGQGIGRLEEVATPALRGYLRGMFGWGYSAASISRKLSALRGFFAYLKETGVLENDPARSLRGPSAPRGLPRALSAESVDAMFKAALEEKETAARDTAILELLYGCGLRVSELAGLKWDDVDIEERWLYVLGKGSKERRVPFGLCAQKALRALAASREGAFVFAGKKGRDALTVRTVHRVVTGLAARCGLSGVSPHVLRHTCATHLLERGAPLTFLQEFLGHESMATTQIYLTVSASWMKESYAAHHPRANAEDAP